MRVANVARTPTMILEPRSGLAPRCSRHWPKWDGASTTRENIRYLMTKRDRMGHDLTGLYDYDNEAVPGEFCSVIATRPTSAGPYEQPGRSPELSGGAGVPDLP